MATTQPLTANLAESTTTHPAVDAPAGTKTYTVASCQRSDGGDPYVIVPIHDSTGQPQDGTFGVVGGGHRIKQIPAAVAAVELAWRRGDAWRLATDAEADAYIAAMALRRTTELTAGDQGIGRIA